jgi:hypothetical protein
MFSNYFRYQGGHSGQGRTCCGLDPVTNGPKAVVPPACCCPRRSRCRQPRMLRQLERRGRLRELLPLAASTIIAPHEIALVSY